MKVKLITYSTENLGPTQRSIISKRINGYTDKSNKSRYTYRRKGLIEEIPNIKVTNKTFILKEKDFPAIKKELKKLGAKVKVWDIKIKKI